MIRSIPIRVVARVAPFQRRKRCDRHGLPHLRSLPERLFETDRELHETQRIAAEREKAILRLHPCRIEHLLEEAFDTFAIAVAGGDRLLCRKAQRTIIDFARWQPRDIRDVRGLDMDKCQAARCNEQATDVLRIGRSPWKKACSPSSSPTIAATTTAPLERLLEGIVTDAQASDLRYAFHAPNDAEKAIGLADRQVARMQFRKVGAPEQGPAATRRSPSSRSGRDRRVRRRCRHRRSLAPSSSSIARRATGNGDADPVFIVL